MQKFNKYLINTILYNNLFFISFFAVDNLNYLWLVINFTINVFLVLILNKYNRKILNFNIFIILSICFGFFYTSFKITSLFLTFFCIYTAILQLTFICKNLQIFNFTKFLNNTIVLIFYFYVFQALSHIFGIPVLNAAGSAQFNESIFRYNTLMAEPSYSSFCIVLLLFFSNILDEKNNLKIELYGFLLIMLYASVLGLILYFFYLITIHRKKYKLLFKFELICIVIILILFANKLNGLDRIVEIVSFFWNNNSIFDLVSIEPSGAFRILPILIYFQKINYITLPNFLFGFGPGASEYFFNYELFLSGYGTADSDGKFLGGFIPAFLLDYGIIPFFVFIYIYLKSILFKKWVFQIILLFFLLLNLNINNQIFWFSFYIFFIGKYIYNNRSYNVEKNFR